MYISPELGNVLMPIAILGSLATGLILFTKTLTDYLLRKKMVEKGLVGDDAGELLKKQQTENKYSSLKWGLIILFGGIGLIILEAINYEKESPLPYGVFATCISLGFLTYFFLVKKLNQSN